MRVNISILFIQVQTKETNNALVQQLYGSLLHTKVQIDKNTAR